VHAAAVRAVRRTSAREALDVKRVCLRPMNKASSSSDS
jgi:hypothetical protein